MLEVRKANLNDSANILEFIREEWSRDHVFLRYQELFEWQHRSGNELSFILAENSGRVEAILGYIPSSHWSHQHQAKTVSLAIWKAGEANSTPGVGLHLLSELRRVERPDRIVAIGVSKIALNIYERLEFSTGVMSHFASGPMLAKYRANENFASGTSRMKVKSSELKGRPIFKNLYPFRYSEFRNEKYIVNRYKLHPSYSYEAFSWKHRKQSCLTIHRSIRTDSLTISRIVDVIGDRGMLPSLGAELHELAVERGWDYIDLVCFGHDPNEMEHGGFVDRFKFPDLVLPHHFEPFENKNVDLAFAVKSYSGSGPGYLYLADSDQDRPNKLPEEIESE